MDKQKKPDVKDTEQLPEEKKGMPDMKKEDRNDPHRGIADTPTQHEELLPEKEEDFEDEPESDDDEFADEDENR